MNINEIVTIKLNENGMGILRAEHAELKSAFPSLHDFVEIEADEDGLYPKKMQLWSVMQTFGPNVRLGAIPPFDAEIDIPGSDEVNKLKAMNKELLAALEGLLSDIRLRAKLDGDVDSDGCVVLNCGDGVLYAANQAIAKAKGTA